MDIIKTSSMDYIPKELKDDALLKWVLGNTKWCFRSLIVCMWNFGKVLNITRIPRFRIMLQMVNIVLSVELMS